MVTKRALHPSAQRDPAQTLNLRLVLPELPATLPSIPEPLKSRPVPKKYPARQHCRTVASRLQASNAPPGLLYLPGQKTSYPPYSDQPHPFRQLRHFYYLSGCPLPDSHITYDITRDKLTLYIPPLDPREVLWTGMPLLPEECLEKFDVDEVRYSNLLRGDLDSWVVRCDDGSGGVVYCLDKESLPPPPPTACSEGGVGLDEQALGDCGWGWTNLRGVVIDTKKLRGDIEDARVYKDDFEVELMKKAIDVTRKGHIAVMDLLKKTLHHHTQSHHSHNSLTEADLEAVYRSACVSSNAKNQAYDPIVCSGRSCATLHYTSNSSPLKGKQLLLIDAGAEWDCYAADITRTYPINGKWTKEAKAVYDIVDRMQVECIKVTVAGKSWRETHFLAARIAVEGLLGLGVFKSKEKGKGKDEVVDEIFKAGTWRAFFPHGLGHMLGLETHDVEGTPDDKSGYKPHDLLSPFSHSRRSHLPPPPTDPSDLITFVNRIIKPNMVLTVEPGIYFCEWIIKPYLEDPKHMDYIDAEVLEKYWDVGGVRIEDVVLVKEEGKGNEVLSKGIPRGW